MGLALKWNLLQCTVIWTIYHKSLPSALKKINCVELWPIILSQWREVMRFATETEETVESDDRGAWCPETTEVPVSWRLRVRGWRSRLWPDIRSIIVMHLLNIINRHIYNRHMWNRLLHNRGNHWRHSCFRHVINRYIHVWHIHILKMNMSPFLLKFILLRGGCWRRQVQDGWNRSRWGR